MPREKMYVQMPGGPVNRRPSLLKSDTSRGDDVQGDANRVTTTGRSETVAGIICNDYVGHSNDISYELCLATDMGDFAPAALPPQLTAAQGDSGHVAKSLIALVGRGVFPLKVVTLHDGRVSTIVATQVSRDLPDTSLFTIPPDYRPMFGQGPALAPR
jgi:Domain of unknown function (DUF4412)